MNSRIKQFDVDHLTKEQKQFLATYFKQNKLDFVLQDQTIHFQSIDFELSKCLVKYQCNWNANDFRILGFDRAKCIAEGGFGKIFKSSILFAPSNDITWQVLPKGSRYVVKEQVVNDLELTQEATLTTEAVLREYELSRLSGMSVKYPIFSSINTTNISYVVTKYYRGDNLDHFLVFQGQLFTAYERIILSIELLRALKEQVHDRDLVHRDIKPSNIRIKLDRSTKTFEVRIIDFGLAKRIDEICFEKAGTQGYISPEAILNQLTTPKSDIYAIGRVLEGVWPCYVLECFIQTSEISKSTANELERLIISMLRAASHTRPNAATCLEKLELISFKHAYEQSQISILDSSDDIRAYRAAKKTRNSLETFNLSFKCPPSLDVYQELLKNIQLFFQENMAKLPNSPLSIKTFLKTLGIKNLNLISVSNLQKSIDANLLKLNQQIQKLFELESAVQSIPQFQTIMDQQFAWLWHQLTSIHCNDLFQMGEKLEKRIAKLQLAQVDLTASKEIAITNLNLCLSSTKKKGFKIHNSETIGKIKSKFSRFHLFNHAAHPSKRPSDNNLRMISNSK